jgi:hypothetical protein
MMGKYLNRRVRKENGPLLFLPWRKRIRLQGAFTVIELLVILATLTVLACILIPSAVRPKRRNICRNNLREIGLAFKVWGQDYPTLTSVAFGGTKELAGSGMAFVHFRVMSNELSTPKVLVCPSDSGKKSAGNFDSGFTDTNVSYFVGLDSADTLPYDLLSGDRNLAVGRRALSPGMFLLTNRTPLAWTKGVHRSCGNILFADASVQLLDSDNLLRAVQKQNLLTNRLAIP